MVKPRLAAEGSAEAIAKIFTVTTRPKLWATVLTVFPLLGNKAGTDRLNRIGRGHYLAR